jgi:hypothetical protein
MAKLTAIISVHSQKMSCRTLSSISIQATAAGSQTKDTVTFVQGSEEPFMLTLRRTEDGGVKFISWFVTVRTGRGQTRGHTDSCGDFR